MIVRHGTLWAIAVLVLLASVSLSESVKLRKPRKRTTARTPYQQPRIGSVIIRVMHKYSDDELKRGASAGCINGNCRNAHNKFHFEPVNEAMSEKDNFLSDEESLRYVVHPEKYEHFVLGKNTGHANRYKRDSTFSELHSSNIDDRTVVNRDGIASEVSKNVNKGNFTRVPLYRTISLDGFNRYKNSKPLSEAGRTRRNLAVDYSSRRNDSDGGDASKVSKNINKGNFTRVPLYRTISLDRLNRYKNSESLSEAGRTRRNLAVDYSSRRNDSGYYAQRKAIMDRYYARQREINARYAANRTSTPRLKYNNVSQHQPTSNATLFNLGHVYPSKDSTARDNATFLHPSTKIDPIYSNESRYNKIPTELDSRRNFVPEIDPGFRSDTDLSQARSSGNNERNALDYFVTPTPCTNLSSNGTFAPKTRPKHAQNCTNETEQSNEDCAYNSADKNNTEGYLRWGKCEGKIVYQHNLLLGLRGPSNLDALFEVIIQGPVCITCVEALRYNETRAIVALDSGGRGHEHAKLRLQGYENEGFFYIIKVWGINKIGVVCDNVD